jgi:hypothetical protein
MRRHIRHLTDLPIVVHSGQAPPQDPEYLRNISRGGLCFRSLAPIPEGSTIRIEVPSPRPVSETEGIVAWCQRAEDGYEVGVRFAGSRPDRDPDLVAEVCQVEHYKREVWIQDGRRLTGEEAVVERIAQDSKALSH